VTTNNRRDSDREESRDTTPEEYAGLDNKQ
jgi:hypothetical protein